MEIKQKKSFFNFLLKMIFSLSLRLPLFSSTRLGVLPLKTPMHRHILPYLLRMLKQFKIVLITGSKQVGKSCFSEQQNYYPAIGVFVIYNCNGKNKKMAGSKNDRFTGQPYELKIYLV